MSFFPHKSAAAELRSGAAVSPSRSGADAGVMVTCESCGHTHAVAITAGRPGGTFAMCPKCGKGRFYDEHGRAFSPSQRAAEGLVRRYGQK